MKTIRTHIAVLAVTLFYLNSAALAQETILDDLDTDSDGKVSVAEFTEYAEGRLPNFDQVDEFAKAVDADSDGFISESEFEDRMAALQKMVPSQEPAEEEEEVDENADPEAKKAFEKLQKYIADDKWADAAKLMTSKAQDETIFQQVFISLGASEMNLPFPNVEDSIDAINAVFEKHGLDDMDVDFSSLRGLAGQRPAGDDDEDEDSDEEEELSPQEKLDKVKKEILTRVKESGKPWEVVGELWNAKKSLPISLSPLSGKIRKQKSDDQEQLLYVGMALAGASDSDAMLTPPAVIRMKKVKGSWMFAGRDEGLTREAMREFMLKRRRQPRTPAREDF